VKIVVTPLYIVVENVQLLLYLSLMARKSKIIKGIKFFGGEIREGKMGLIRLAAKQIFQRQLC
jgi:hypothetical protein